MEENYSLLPGTSNALKESLQSRNPFLEWIPDFHWELVPALSAFGPSLRPIGRPSELNTAVVADIIADEIRGVNPKRIWPMVAAILEPFLNASNSKILRDPKHIR